MVERIKEICKILDDASRAYYMNDSPIMTDKEYDDLVDELAKLEKKSGIVMANSPLHKVQGEVLDGFEKVTHSKPMLSADKTKDLGEIKKFLGKNDFYASYKLDGLTLVLRYKNGKFIQGITRGNGEIGEDVTIPCKFIKNIPMKIPCDELEVRGECVMSWEEFNRVNETLTEPYSHPRNLAAGTLRNLDTSVIKNRELSFICFEVVTDIGVNGKYDCLNIMDTYGFTTVPRIPNENVEDCVSFLKPENYTFPVDGIIFELNDRKYAESLGKTGHHERARMALKWADDLYETTLRDVEWSTSKTGLINPVAVFDEVNLDGALTTRATLHNISYIKQLELGVGDTIEVYKANMIIPKVHNNLTRSNSLIIPDTCPCCNSPAEIRKDGASEMLYCTNPSCSAVLQGKITNAVTRAALNIDGLSESIIGFLIDKGWIKGVKDLYHLKPYYSQWVNTEGFGKKSVDKLFDAIEKSRNTTLDKFICALNIPLIGKTASKDIAKFCKYDVNEFYSNVVEYDCNKFQFIDGIGAESINAIRQWVSKEWIEALALGNELTFENPNKQNGSVDLSGKTFVITGSVYHFNNRDEIKTLIEDMGGKVSSSVSAKTFTLICNDKDSNTGKSKKAKDLGVQIITEDEFIEMIGGVNG